MDRSALFDQIPGGEVTVEIPDGVTKTEGFHAPNSLLNSGWACGGYDGHGYGAFKGDGDGAFAVVSGRPSDRFRVG